MNGRFLTVVVALVLTCTATRSALGECGVGTRLWQGREGVVATVMASTTNWFTFYGISTTFEIAGCTAKDNIFKRAAAEKVHHYASNNFDRLASDMARGRGEHLDAFVAVLQLDEEDQAYFKAFSQENLDHLFPRDDVTVEEFLGELGDRMAQSATLSRYVEH